MNLFLCVRSSLDVLARLLLQFESQVDHRKFALRLKRLLISIESLVKTIKNKKNSEQPDSNR